AGLEGHEGLFRLPGGQPDHRVARCDPAVLRRRTHRGWRELDGNDPEPQPVVAHLQPCDGRSLGATHHGVLCRTARGRLRAEDGDPACRLTMTRDSASPRTRSAPFVAPVRRSPWFARGIVFGSRAKGNHRPGSDIDLTLDGAGLGLPDLLAIESDID